MQYMLIFNEGIEWFANREDATHSGPYWGAWTAYVQAMYAAGVVVSGNGLLGPQTATTVRIRDGQRLVQDGPFADSKEQLGGYFIIDVPDLDVALDWAAKSPAAVNGSVEVRPVMPPMKS